MELRSGTTVGSHLLPSPNAKAAFEEGAALTFRRWTALALAVENQWGGPTSTDKANWLLEQAIQWFYRNKDHYWDELADELDDALVQDFNVEAEDGSPDEIAKQLVALYQECQREEFATVLALRAQAAAAPSGAARSSRQVVDNDGTVMGDDDDSSGEDDDEDMDVAPQAVPLQQQQAQPEEPRGPIIDEDGFELVQTKGKRGRR